MKITGLVARCKDCPHSYHNDCTKAGARIPEIMSIPDWCPLPDHLAGLVETLRGIIRDKDKQLQSAIQ